MGVFVRFLITIFLLAPKLSYSQTFSKSGFINLSSSLRNQSSQFEEKKLPDFYIKNHLNNQSSAGSDSQIFLKIMKENSEDVFGYGVVAKTEFNLNSDGRNLGPAIDQIFTFFEGGFGKVELGNNQPANQQMKTGPAKFARGAGGINGKYLENINLPMVSGSDSAPHFILLAQSPVGHGGYAKSFYQPTSTNISGYHESQYRALKDDSFDGIEDATKISYYSPRVDGIKVGASYVPDGAKIGLTKQISYDSSYTRIENIFSVGVNYFEDFDNLGVELSTTAERGKIRNANRKDLFAYDFGGSLSYFGFTLGGSWGYWGDSLQVNSGDYSKKGKTDYRTFGLSYKFGPFATSLTSINSSFQRNKYSAISFGIDCKLRRNLMPYFEVTKFAFNSAKTGAIDNSGYVLLSGIVYSF